MPRLSVEQLLMAGAHFGHLTKRWNPKMKPYIFMAKNGIYIIDLKKTQSLLDEACERVMDIVQKGDKMLFVGTKKQAKDIVRKEAERSGQYYVNERWLGGALTNFRTVRKSVKTLEQLEKKAVDGTYERIRKKEILGLERKKEKLIKYLGGVREMNRLPGGLFVVDTKKELIAVTEARKLDIPVFAILDTNGDPELVDYPIPANDDAYKSIGLIVKTFSDAIVEGCQRPKEEPVPEEKKPEVRRPMRRLRRKTAMDKAT